MPGDVGGGAPLSLERLLVQHGGVDEPDVGLAADLIPADTVGVGPGCGAPGPAGHVVGLASGVAVGPDLDVREGQALLAVRGCLDSPLAVLVYPVELEALVFGVLLNTVESAVGRSHRPPPQFESRSRTCTITASWFVGKKRGVGGACINFVGGSMVHRSSTGSGRTIAGETPALRTLVRLVHPQN